LEKRAEQVLPGSERDGERSRQWGSGGRNDPNIVCIYEYMNKEEKKPWMFRCLWYLYTME
jgi:hypothetical protein